MQKQIGNYVYNQLKKKDRLYTEGTVWLLKPGLSNNIDIFIDYSYEERQELLQYRFKKYPGKIEYEKDSL